MAHPSHAGRRLAITMWEFSWLVRRFGEEAEYRDWDRVLDELGERGYDCVRLDAFPHLVARGPNDEAAETFTILPQNKRFMWGNHAAVDVAPRPALVEFLGKLRERNMRAGLSSWFNDDTTHRRAGIIEPADYVRIWGETLDFLAAEGCLDVVEWVDLCNEFPLGMWAPGPYAKVLGARWPNFLPMISRWTQQRRRQLEAYFDAIDQLRQRHPNLRYTYSFQFWGARNLRSLDVGRFDVAEIHIWLTDNIRFNFRSGQLWALAELPGGLALHRWLAPYIYRWSRRRWLERLDRCLEGWRSWAVERNLPLYTTEGWASVCYGDRPGSTDGAEWDWLKDLCGEAVQMAIDKGWQGICTSNFCQPHFRGMWRDVKWHRALTDAIKKGVCV